MIVCRSNLTLISTILPSTQYLVESFRTFSPTSRDNAFLVFDTSNNRLAAHRACHRGGTSKVPTRVFRIPPISCLAKHQARCIRKTRIASSRIRKACRARSEASCFGGGLKELPLTSKNSRMRRRVVNFPLTRLQMMGRLSLPWRDICHRS